MGIAAWYETFNSDEIRILFTINAKRLDQMTRFISYSPKGD